MTVAVDPWCGGLLAEGRLALVPYARDLGSVRIFELSLPVALAILERAREDFSSRESENADAMHLVVQPLAVVRELVLLGVDAASGPLAADKTPVIPAAVGIRFATLAMGTPLIPFADKAAAIRSLARTLSVKLILVHEHSPEHDAPRVGQYALSGGLPLAPLPLILGAVDEYHLSLAVDLAIDEASVVHPSVREAVLALPVPDALNPVARVVVVVGIRDLSGSVMKAGLEFAHILGTARTLGDAGAPALVFPPVTVETASIRPFELSAAVEHVVLEFAHVDSAVRPAHFATAVPLAVHPLPFVYGPVRARIDSKAVLQSVRVESAYELRPVEILHFHIAGGIGHTYYGMLARLIRVAGGRALLRVHGRRDGREEAEQGNLSERMAEYTGRHHVQPCLESAAGIKAGSASLANRKRFAWRGGISWAKPMDSMRIAIAQLNPTVGDLDGNRCRARVAVEAATRAGAGLVVLPEMFMTGYPLQDLVSKRPFVEAAMDAVRGLAEDVERFGAPVAVGGPFLADGAVYNALHVLEGGVVQAVIRKHRLPNFGVFDEPRNFRAGNVPGPVAIRGVLIGFAICEDFWSPDVAETLAETGAELLVCVNGSPYESGKHDERIGLMVARVVENGLPLVYANLIGGQDDQVYDGGSFVLNRGGGLAAQAPFFEEAVLLTDWSREGTGWRCTQGDLAPVHEGAAADYRCLVQGLRDFAGKNGFKDAILGLSGGIDSALVAAIAGDALGHEHVRAVLLPSRFTGEESIRCARDAAAMLDCSLEEVKIEPAVRAIRRTLEGALDGPPAGAAGENIQARARGLLLMAIANSRGELLLATGNKSEMAVGYATLYGDMCGGYACLKDVYKTQVYALARWRNANHAACFKGPAGRVIPELVLERAPTAELRPDQRDEDSLPPYSSLDSMLEMLIERDGSAAELVEAGYAREDAERVAALVRNAEFKRYQSPPGPKITRRAFWLERRYPITCRYTG